MRISPQPTLFLKAMIPLQYAVSPRLVRTEPVCNLQAPHPRLPQRSTRGKKLKWQLVSSTWMKR